MRSGPTGKSTSWCSDVRLALADFAGTFFISCAAADCVPNAAAKPASVAAAPIIRRRVITPHTSRCVPLSLMCPLPEIFDYLASHAYPSTQPQYVQHIFFRRSLMPIERLKSRTPGLHELSRHKSIGRVDEKAHRFRAERIGAFLSFFFFRVSY